MVNIKSLEKDLLFELQRIFIHLIYDPSVNRKTGGERVGKECVDNLLRICRTMFESLNKRNTID